MAPTSENAQAKRRPGRPKADSATTTTAKANGRAAKSAGINKPSAVTRQPLAEITNTHEASDDDDSDILSDDKGISDGAMTTLPKPAAVSKTTSPVHDEAEIAKPRGRRGRPRTMKEEISETQPDPEVMEASSKFAHTTTTTTKKGRPAKREVIPETQPEPMVVDESGLPSSAPDVEDRSSRPAVRQTSRVPSLTRTRQASVTRQPSRSRQPSVTRRNVSASDTERGGSETTLRRKVGDLTKKLESLELKYENLTNVAVRDADSNFDRLKKQVEIRSQAADDLIASLRAELAAERQRNSQAEHFRNELDSLRKASDATQADKKSLQTQLNEAKNEVKSLQAKLAAARSSSADAGNSKVPGSAIKQQNGTRTLIVGSAEAAKEAQKRVLKEELYRDLTGLLVMDVKRREAEDGEEDVFDCIQTGRNGSLHFHLAVAIPGTATAPKTPGTTFDDAEFQYEPRLNDERDRDLLDLLPDYLTEDICFPRSNAAKFYARVVDCLTKKVEVVEEDEDEMEEEGTVGERTEVVRDME